MIIFGKQVVLHAIAKKRDCINEIYVAKKMPKDVFENLKQAGKKIIVIDPKKAQALARGGNHQGILAHIEPPRFFDFKQMLDFENLVILCGITDVGNIGAIIRSAWCLGAQAVVIADVNLSENALAAIVRSSAGAALEMPICVVKNSSEIINNLKMAQFTLLGASMSGVDCVQFLQNLSTQTKHKDDKITDFKFALFLGAEDVGIAQKTLKKLDQTLKIAMKNDFDSLNVSASAAILLDRLLNRG